MNSLKESIKKYKAVFDATSDMICIQDIKTGEVLDMNKATLRLCGISKQALIKKGIAGVTPKDPKYSQKKAVRYLKQAAQGKPQKFEWAFIDRHGKSKITTVNLKRIKIDGRYCLLAVARDITKVKAIETELKESEEKYRQLIERANDVVIILQDSKVKFANPRLKKLLGYKPKEIMGKKFLKFVDLRDIEMVKERYEKRMAGKKVPSIYELRLINKSGKSVYVEANAGIIQFQGKPADLVYVRDIEDRKKNKLQLEESEKKYRTLFENMDDAFALHKVIKNKTGKVVDYEFIELNKGFSKMTGLSRKKCIGKTVTEIIPGIEKDPANWIKRYGKIAEEGPSETFIQYSEALKKWYQVIAYSPRKDYFATIFSDVTEEIKTQKTLKQQMQDLKKFKLAVDNTSDQIVITDPTGIILYVNKAMVRTTGFSEKELVNHKMGTKELFGGNMSNTFYKELWKTIKNHKTFTGDIINTRKNGQKYDAFVNISPISEKGKIVFYVGVSRDITKEKEIDRAKTEFVSIASHQLRTPLSIINWCAETLLMPRTGKINKKQLEYLNSIYEGNHRMIELVNSLLNVSRLELGTFAIEPAKLNINTVIKKIIKQVESEAQKENITIKQKLDSKIKTTSLDEALMTIIIENLLVNAIHYTPNKGLVTITTKQLKKYYEISIQDTGYGIPEDQQSRIFEKFFRADNIREKNITGTGLGLYIVKQILNAVKGDIKFTSQPNKGTNFTITLPLSGMKRKAGSKQLT